MTSVISAIALAVAVQGQAPTPVQIQGWYESGQDRQVVNAAQDRSEPRVIYLAGLAHLRLNERGRAQEQFERLARRPETDAWHHIGRSAALLSAAPASGGNVAPEAETAARRAIEIDSSLALAHYQLGLVFGRENAYDEAAAAFDRAAALDPRFAYAHYYGALAHYRNNETTQMAVGFENFLKVAPSAPERSQVESIMRTLRGR